MERTLRLIKRVPVSISLFGKFLLTLSHHHSIASSLMLTLDPTTLFYFSLRDLDDKNKHAGLIKDWATKIPRNAKPGDTRSKATPSLTQGSTRSSHVPPSTRSALTMVKIGRHDDGIEIAEGGLSDLDETKGAERDAAIKSPPKGRQRISSSVSHHCLCDLLSYLYIM